MLLVSGFLRPRCLLLMESLFLGSLMTGIHHHHHRRSNSSSVLASPWFVPSLGECRGITSSLSFTFYCQVVSYHEQESYHIRWVAVGSISPLVGCLCIPWCELSLWNINEKSYHLHIAHLILVCNLYYMIDLVISIGITLGALNESIWFWQTQHWSIAITL